MLRLLWCLALLAATALVSGSAAANGRFPRSERLLEDPRDTSHLILAGTFGLIVSSDAGGSWDYVCEASFAEAGLDLDPLVALASDGALLAGIPPRQILGCVVYPASELTAPGVVRHIEGDRFPIGELDGSMSERATRVSACFEHAGFKAPVLDNIRAEMWLKLWGNLTFNPISALSHATLVDICQFPATRELATQMMQEAQAIAHKLGITFRLTLDKRIAGAEKVGKHKTSMLQDVEAGRAPEIDALVGSVVELGRLTGTPTPHIDAVYALVKLLARTMEQQQGRLEMQTLPPACTPAAPIMRAVA